MHVHAEYKRARKRVRQEELHIKEDSIRLIDFYFASNMAPIRSTDRKCFLPSVLGAEGPGAENIQVRVN